MKFMNNHYGVSRIFCAPSPTDGGSGSADDEAGDDQDDEESDEDGGDDEPEEKKYTEKDIEDAVKRRLSRERRKWQRQQQKSETKSDSGDKAGKSGGGNEETEADRKAREAEEKANALELKWTCLEHDVKKDCVDDVLALARVHVSKDNSLDIEDAIDKVLDKYPQFKDGYDNQDDEGEDSDGKKKGWGQRHGKPPKKSETVDDEIRKQLFGK
ncbi:hypothetical protein NE454_15860 [Blautia producta]|uniref:hypothetical protein n=1 Tax=Blautia producta TaxID=33035 RepID=UPI00210D5A3A|nr:hypothetical protein [Blautia producta]MCQ5125879.1 hypothetical protein [Blautia producta]